MDQRLDYLFIDEAGQVSLADAVAMGTAARNVVLLGDPQQLPHVRQGVHPGDSGCSVLEHLLVGRATVPDDRGVFLEPDVAHAPGRLRVHLAALVRRPAGERRGTRPSADHIVWA